MSKAYHLLSRRSNTKALTLLPLKISIAFLTAPTNDEYFRNSENCLKRKNIPYEYFAHKVQKKWHHNCISVKQKKYKFGKSSSEVIFVISHVY